MPSVRLAKAILLELNTSTDPDVWLKPREEFCLQQVAYDQHGERPKFK